MDGVNIANLGKTTIRRKHVLSTPVERAHTNAPVRKQKTTPKNAAQTDLHTVRSRLVMVPQVPVLFQVSHILFDSKACVGSYRFHLCDFLAKSCDTLRAIVRLLQGHFAV